MYNIVNFASIIIGTWFIVVIAALWWKMRHDIRLFSKIPGPSFFNAIKLGIIGCLSDYNQIFLVIHKLGEEYGSIMGVWYGMVPLVMTKDPNHVDKLYKHNPLCKRAPDLFMQKTMTAFKGGVLEIEGESWKLHRKILNNAFHINTLESYTQNFAYNSKILARRLSELATGSFQRLDIIFIQCTMDIVIETCLGYEFDVQRRNDVQVVENLLEVLNQQTKRFVSPWYFLDSIFERTSAYKKLLSVIANLRGLVEMGVRHKMALVHQMEENGVVNEEARNYMNSLAHTLINTPELSEEETVGELTCITGAGAETSSTTCCFALALLCEHQDIQQQIFEEQKSLYQNDLLRPVTKEDLHYMPYLEKVLKETLRLFPALPLIFREAIHELDLGNDQIIPKGTLAMINLYELQRSPEHFPDPEKFDPERFSPENCIGRHPYAFMPFGVGRRMCVGYNFAMMEMKTIMSTLIRRYHFLEVKGGVKGILNSLEIGLVLKPKINFHFKFLPRENINMCK